MKAVQKVIPQMQDGDEHTLRACSLLLIPPPPPGEQVRRESVPLSLADMADPDWIKNGQRFGFSNVDSPNRILCQRPADCLSPSKIGESYQIAFL